MPLDPQLHLWLAPHPSVRAAQLRWLEQPGHHLLPCTDPRYPSALAARADRPRVLYVAGRLEALRPPCITVVGSRLPTPAGREIAQRFAAALATRGFVIVSGLAEGIDAAAHRGALAAAGLTLAVLGHGPDIVYPRAHAALGAEIGAAGALISEFAPGTPPRRAQFARRNRLMAALGLGTVVIEAARGSGSLITARAAQLLSRPLFAVPGSIFNPLSRGCHALIREGAELVESVDDILRGLGWHSSASVLAPDAAAAACRARPGGLDKQHEILLDAVGFDAVDVDTLVVRTGFRAAAVSSMMLILELEGHVQAAPGGRYSRANRRAGGEGERSRSAHLSVRELHERR